MAIQNAASNTFNIFFHNCVQTFKIVGIISAVSRQDVHQRDGSVLHIVHERVDFETI